MANYNQAHFLKESLPLIFAQTRPADEIIVVDDGSTDNSVEVLREFETSEKRLKVLPNGENRGVNFSVNRGLTAATSDLVCFHSADDAIAPEFFEQTVGMLEKHPEAGLCCSFFSKFKSSTGEVDDGRRYWSSEPAYLSPHDLARLRIAGGIPGHCSIYSKKAVMEAGGPMAELEWHSDWFMIHVIAARRGICFIPAALGFLRINDEGSYSSGSSRWESQKDVMKTLFRLLFSERFIDVVPFFEEANVMSVLASDVSRLLIEEPDFWTEDAVRSVIAMLEPSQQRDLLGPLNARQDMYRNFSNICKDILASEGS